MTENDITKVSNINGIELYYEIATDVNKLNILDSNKNYFNDLYLETDDIDIDIKTIVKTLEETDLQSMCAFFGTHTIITKEETKNYGEEYINEFRIGDKTYYVLFD